MTHASWVWTIVLLAGCAGTAGTPPATVRQSRSATLALATAGTASALPSSNGFRCTLTLPANSAPAGATITITMPAEGAALAGASGPIPASGEIVATTSANVTFQGFPAVACSPSPPSLSSAPSFVDPNTPGALYNPNIVVVNGTSTLFSVAGVPFPIGYL